MQHVRRQSDHRDGERRRRPGVPAARSPQDAVVALQRHAGNAAVTALLRQPATTTPELTPAQEEAAAATTRSRFHTSSLQTIQMIISIVWSGGRWDRSSTQALVRWHQSHLGGDGKGVVDDATLGALLTEGVARGLQTEVIHLVADYFRLDRTLALSIRHDPTLHQEFFIRSSSGLQRIVIGDPALTSVAKLKATLEEALRDDLLDPSTPTPITSLRPDEARKAAAENARALRDERSVRAIQGFLGEDPTGSFTADTSRRIADFQVTERLAPDPVEMGRLTDATLRLLLDKMIATGDEDLAIRLIIDWYQINDSGALDILVDPSQPQSHALNTGGRPAPTMITFGAAAFAFGHESLVHTVQEAFVEARANVAGLAPAQARFLGERARVLSGVQDAFATDPDPAQSLGFVLDARRALSAFTALPASVKVRLKGSFESLRNAVVNRFDAADPPDRANHAQVFADYQAVTF